MPILRSARKPLLAALATLFAAATVLYSGLWTLYGNRAVPVELGFDNRYIPVKHCQFVQSVVRGSPAERSGLKREDCITRVNSIPMETEDSLTRIWTQHKPGDAVELTVERAGASTPVFLHATFRASGSSSAEAGAAQHVGQGILTLYPVAFLTVGLAVLFLRLEDPNAWLLALMFAGFIGIPNFANAFLAVPSSLRPFAMVYRTIFDNLAATFFYFFFAIFPTRSPLDRRLPWLKWLALMVGLVLALPARWASGVGALGGMFVGHGRVLILTFNYGLVLLGFVSLTWNAVSVTSSEARRKIRVILWGTLVGCVPATLDLAGSDFFGWHIPLLLVAVIVLLLWLFPLSFAYAVIKHRVLEIPVLLRRSARYLLVQRGFAVLLVLLSVGVTWAFALFFARYLQPLTGAAIPGGIGLGTVFGTFLLWSGAQVHKDVGKRIDRAFFRNAYDARIILEDLLEKTRTATDRKELAALLEYHLTEALQPSSLVVYLETNDDRLLAVAGDAPPEFKAISATYATLSGLARQGRPLDVSGYGANDVPTPLSFGPLQADCLVPILGRDSRLIGLVVLGQRLSEEPYSSEDKHLLASVARQAGVALESIRLGEKVAERIEAERRTAQEMEFARQVQSRLFPQKLPAMKTLEYVGGCTPARTVGGDYYDFLELRPGRLALVLADIAGKGVSGALLMANLQANVRSQYAMAIDDLPRLLASINRLFYESTDVASYATLFFADYDDSSRKLRYANCGHLPPLLLRAGGSQQVEWLHSTSTVMGLFEAWRCEIAEVQLAPGDVLVLYTDGITEAANADGEEFGECHLLDTLKGNPNLPAPLLLQAVVGAVQQFSGGSEQQDDITVVIARSLA
jgi:sigma-B regulation protein RsbU (phosphoserine phosphatase)